jgi:hypothetical protein
MHLLSNSLAKITKPIFNKYGFAHIEIVSKWSQIVGEKISNYTLPRKITYSRHAEKSEATLHIDVSSSAMATELYYLEPLILEKIAVYLGHKAISKLKLQQNPTLFTIRNLAIKDSKQLQPNDHEKLTTMLKDVADEDLQLALYKLGQSIISK